MAEVSIRCWGWLFHVQAAPCTHMVREAELWGWMLQASPDKDAHYAKMSSTLAAEQAIYSDMGRRTAH